MFRLLDAYRGLFGYQFMVTIVIFAIMFTAIWWIKLLSPSAIPYDLFHFWKFEGTVGEVLSASWGIFVWGTIATAFLALRARNDHKDNQRAESYFLQGTILSLWAGITEEIGFRWLYFYLLIPAYLLSSHLLFGLPEWIYRNIGGPISNILTLGALEPFLLQGNWAVGAALVQVNIRFQDQHKYLGLIGWLNSWFIGMFMFYLMFHFGLLAGILVHAIYDFLIFLVYYLDALIERSFRMNKENGGKDKDKVLLKI